jgi:ketosteroid isomerase-like protein
MTPEGLMRRLAKAFEHADFQSLVAAVDEAVVWHVGERQRGPLGLGGSYLSRAGLLEVTARLATLLNFYRFAPKEIIADGEIAWGWFEVAATLISRPSCHVHCEVAMRWRVRNGKILESQCFYDTADVAAQLAAHLG